MNLPKKDSLGHPYLSYSQINTFKNNKQDFINRYILNKPFEGNEYTDFGLKVGTALEKNNFNDFTDQEMGILKQCTRLDWFERKTTLEYDGFYIMGFIDTISDDYNRIIDYKTGGSGKEFQYLSKDYTQIQLYALSIRQETGITPTKGSVEFIRREGNAFRGEQLLVADEKPIILDIDLSENRLKEVYWNTLEIAKQIEKFYNNYLKNNV